MDLHGYSAIELQCENDSREDNDEKIWPMG